MVAVDLTNATRVEPEAVAATDATGKINLADAKPDEPGVAQGITAERMPAVVAAGVQLVKYVLAMVMASSGQRLSSAAWIRLRSSKRGIIPLTTLAALRPPKC